MNHNDAHNFNQIANEFDNFEEFNSSVRGWSVQFKQASRGTGLLVWLAVLDAVGAVTM